MKTYNKLLILLIILLFASSIKAQWKLNSYWPHGSCNAVTADGQYVYVGSGGILSVWDYSDPYHPIKIGEVATSDAIKDIVVSGNYIYVANRYSGFTVIDNQDPYNPTICANNKDVMYCRNLFVRDTLAYLASPDGFWILNIKDPCNPELTGSIFQIGMGDVYVSGNYAYITEQGLSVIDITDPSHPEKISHIGSDTTYYIDIYVHEGFAYITESNRGLNIYNVQDPENPVFINNLYNGEWVWDVWGKDDLIFLPLDNPEWIHLRVLDISDPENITEVGSLGDVSTDWEQLYVYGDYVLWTNTYSGVRIVDISDPAKPFKTSVIPTSGPCYDVMVQDSLIYVVNNDFFILIKNDTEILQELGSYTTPFYEDGSAVSVFGNNAYMSGHEGLRIIDIADKSNPVEYSSILDRKGDLPGGGLSASPQYAYWLSKDAGFVIVDISQPESPLVLNEFGGGRNTFVYQNMVFCAFGGNETEDYKALEIYDISDPTNQVLISKLDMPELVQDDIGLLVQDDRAYLGALDSITILDISDPQNPQRINTFKVHYVYAISVSDDFLYSASYHGGVFIYDISDPKNPICVDTLGYESFDCQNVLIKDNRLYICDYNFGLYVFEKPGGPSKICKNAGNTSYSTKGSRDVYSYIWSIDPETAGIISGSDTLALVSWSDTFTGATNIIVRGINSMGEDVYFDTLKVEILDYPASAFIFDVDGLEIEFENLSTNATSFLWEFDDGSYSSTENPIHYYESQDTYNVALYAFSDYCGENNSMQTINLATNLNINENDDWVRMYPNPTSSYLLLETNNLAIENIELSIINIEGQIVHFEEVEIERSTIINLPKLNKGIYFIKINSDKEFSQMNKLIIN
jgi:hypothetical protein